MKKYFGFLTDLGLALDANSKVTGNAVVCAEMVFSSSEAPVEQSMTAMPNVVATVPVNDARISLQDENVALIEAILPPEMGGFYVRSAGVLDADGNLYAVANLGESYKPAIAEGAAEDLLQIIQFVSANTDNITVSIDPSVVRATRPWVEGILMERDMSIASVQMMTAKNLLDNDLQDTRANAQDAAIQSILGRVAELTIHQTIIGDRASRAVLN